MLHLRVGVAGPPKFDLTVPPSEVTKARNAAQRERLQEELYQALKEEAREQQRKTVQQAADEFLKDYSTKQLSRYIRRSCPFLK